MADRVLVEDKKNNDQYRIALVDNPLKKHDLPQWQPVKFIENGVKLETPIPLERTSPCYFMDNATKCLINRAFVAHWVIIGWE